MLINAGAALVGLLGLAQVPVHDNELVIALSFWVVALPAALGAAFLTEWQAEAQERADRGRRPWAEPAIVRTKMRTAQIALCIVANVAVVAGYAAFVKHFDPSAGAVLFVLAVIFAASGAAVCWPAGKMAEDPRVRRRESV